MNSRDLRGTTWLDGWGHDKQLMTQLERRARDENARREIDEEFCDCAVTRRWGWRSHCPHVYDQWRLGRPAFKDQPADWENDALYEGTMFFNKDPERALRAPGPMLVWRSEQMTLYDVEEILSRVDGHELRRMGPDDIEAFLTK